MLLDGTSFQAAAVPQLYGCVCVTCNGMQLWSVCMPLDSGGGGRALVFINAGVCMLSVVSLVLVNSRRLC